MSSMLGIMLVSSLSRLLQPALIAGLLLLQSSAPTNAASICFFPNGRQSPDLPCDPEAEVSMCCGSVSACLSNGLCKDTSTTNTTGISYARGTCTDPTWQSPHCPQHCVLNQDTAANRSAFDFRSNGCQVWECDASGFGTPANYCCESAAEKTRCCSTSKALFMLPSATPGNAEAVQTWPYPTEESAVTEEPTVTKEATATGGATSAGGVTSTGGATSTMETTSTMEATTTEEVTSTKEATSGSGVAAKEEGTGTTTGVTAAETPEDEEETNSMGLGPGAVVGTSLLGASTGVALIIAAVAYIRRRRRNASLAGMSQDGSLDSSSDRGSKDEVGVIAEKEDKPAMELDGNAFRLLIHERVTKDMEMRPRKQSRIYELA